MQPSSSVQIFFIILSITKLSGIESQPEQCFKLLGLLIFTRDDVEYSHLNQPHWTSGTIHRPEGFILVRNVIEVQNAVECSKEYDINLAIKSGGHSFESYSFGCNQSWVIDLRLLNSISINNHLETVSVGAGVLTTQLEQALWKHRFILPMGIWDNIGIAGISMGGGIGIISRKYGLTVDQIKAIEIVTADDQVLIASTKRRNDLFWALRGAGGGNYGIVTKITMKLHRPPKFVARIRKKYDIKDAALIFYHWQLYFTSDELDNSVFSEFNINYLKDSVLTVPIEITSDTKVNRDALIDEIKHAFPNITDEDIEYYDNFIDLQHSHLEQKVANSSKPICRKTLSFFVSKQLTYVECKKMTDVIKNSKIWIVVASVGGYINIIDPKSTSWVHRTSKYHVWFRIDNGCDDTEVRNALAVFHKLRFMDNGESYQNYISKLQKEYLQRYYGKNLQRLIQVKNKYDPKNFFCFPQSIPLDLHNSKNKCSCNY